MNTCNVMLPQPLALQFLFYFILKTELLNSIYLSVYYQIEEKKIWLLSFSALQYSVLYGFVKCIFSDLSPYTLKLYNKRLKGVLTWTKEPFSW